jgi:hypothetical protein
LQALVQKAAVKGWPDEGFLNFLPETSVQIIRDALLLSQEVGLLLVLKLFYRLEGERNVFALAAENPEPLLFHLGFGKALGGTPGSRSSTDAWMRSRRARTRSRRSTSRFSTRGRSKGVAPIL